MTAIPTLSTSRLTLRAPALEDFPHYAAFWDSDRAGHVGGRRDVRWAWGKFAAHLGHWSLRGFGWWTALDAAGPVGFVGIHRPEPHPHPEIGWTLYAHATGRGYATEAARAALDWWFGRGETRLVAHIDRDHPASQAVARRLGGRDTGTPPAHQPGGSVWTFGPGDVPA